MGNSNARQWSNLAWGSTAWTATACARRPLARRRTFACGMALPRRGIPLDSLSETPFTEAEVADLCRRVQEGRHPPLLEEDFQTATCRLIVLWKLGKEIMPSIDIPMGARPRERLVADPTRWSEAQKVIRQIVEYQPPRQPVPTEAAETARAIWGRWEATTAGTQGARAHFQRR
eukprot:jgi/Tetstr1/456747/TSEL_043444.t1